MEKSGGIISGLSYLKKNEIIILRKLMRIFKGVMQYTIDKVHKKMKLSITERPIQMSIPNYGGGFHIIIGKTYFSF